MQPHRSRSFQLSTDPFFIEKVRDIVLLIGYLYGITSEASWRKSCACIWLGGGSRAWVSIKKFHTIPRFLSDRAPQQNPFTDAGGAREWKYRARTHGTCSLGRRDPARRRTA